ncbi:alpha-xylosidase [Spirochaeta dissipatitropha]
MKFTDGFWRSREGFQVNNAFKVHDYETGASDITAYAPVFDVQNRGQTLQGPLLGIRLSSPMPDIIRVQVSHYIGRGEQLPRFIDHEDHKDVKIVESPEHLQLVSGGLTARLSLDGKWALDFLRGDTCIVNSREKNLGYVIAPDGRAYMKEQLSLGFDELVYGLGERFTPLVKNGQVVESWNGDGGTSSDQAYKAVPFYLTSGGYGVLVNDPGEVSFEVASEKVSRVQFSVPGEYLDYYIINGPDPKAVLDRYTALTGRPALPPAWSFGLWLTTSFVTEYDEKTVSSFVDGMAERDIPLHVFHFDCFWMREYHWMDFEWDERWFPDIRGFIQRLKDRGLKICVWINPYIGQRSRIFKEGMDKGYLLKRADGSVYQVDTWQPGMAFVDFTNPAACRWYESYLESLLEIGVDCFKTDFGELIPVDDVAWHDGSDALKMHNYYSYIYNKTVFDLLEKKRGRGDAVLFARSATAGGQQFPVHWGGDCTASFESMAESLRGGLSLGMCGFGFWSHDISGFEMTASPALYKRWAAFGLLSSHSRLHGNASYRVPWLFDEESVDVVRHFTRLKARLMPYLYAASLEDAVRGIPLMRSMFLEFPDDPACRYLDRQYMLGDSLLVAPVFSDQTECSFYLPDGQWRHLLSGKQLSGGKWVSEQHDFMSLPLYVREKSMIAFGSEDNHVDYDYAENVEIQLYHLPDGSSAECRVYSPQGECELELSADRQGGEIRIEVKQARKPWKLRYMSTGTVHDGSSRNFSIEAVDAEGSSGGNQV